MRIGVIGAGLQARRRCPAIAADDQIVIVAGLHEGQAQALASQHGAEWAIGWEPVIARDDLDAVMVLTPPDLHEVITVAALRRGLHVLCEKPLTRTLAEAESIVRVAKETGRIVKCGFNHRHHPAFRQVRAWVDAGEIGEPMLVRARYGIGGRPGYEQEWRANPSIVGGGQLMEQGIHAIDLARWFLGEFTEATGFAETMYWQTGALEDNGFALLRTAGGRVAQVHSSLTQWRNRFSFELVGRDGYAQVEGLGTSYGTEQAILGKRDFDGPFAEQIVDFRGDDRSWSAEWAEFKAAIAEGREPLGSAADGLQAMRAVYAVYEAARTRAFAPIAPAPPP